MANIGPATTPGRYTVAVADEQFAVEVGIDGSVHVHGYEPTLAAVPLGAGEYRIDSSAGSWHVFVVTNGVHREVFVDGEVYRCEVLPEGAARRVRPAALDGLAAPMPARVVAIRADRGQAVRRGDILITLEAMKMELSIRAPHDGIVRAVACEPGQLVQPGVRLIEIAESV